MTICASCGQENPKGFKFCGNCAAPLEPTLTAREQRKTVTVLFCDVTGSTALAESTDPEALRALLARYFERMKAIVEHHGGTVEKFIGDAVMAVFGVPQVHEDDALRAVRAAIEMREALPELGVQARIGVNTGEVVTGTAERLATGDAVNVAARLEQVAQPGEILIGDQTLVLVGNAVDVEQVEPLELKGRTGPVEAHRLLALSELSERSHETVFVGRERELDVLRQAWQRARGENRCELVTVVGDAGVGKSRLTAEFLGVFGERVVHGRCLPYGDGITYWPVVEVLKQLGDLPADADAAAALRALLGDTDARTSADEIAWAFRKLLEERGPIACVVDDLQWAEDTFLELIEGVALLASGTPILLLCLARPELVERRPEWPVSLRLGPLPEQDVRVLISELPEALGEKVARAAGGNPLFVGEMLAVARESDGEIAVPPTLRAVLAARLDRLEVAERSALERGAIEGEIFHHGAVQALSDNGRVTPLLAALVRKQLIRREKPLLAGDHAFRFAHLLIRDAAYDALPKRTRAELHERFAAWLAQSGGELIELDELLGYHLEQVCRYRGELGASVDRELARSASEHFAGAGYRALRRQDYHAAASLLQRAAALMAPGEFDFVLETELRDALFWLGKREEAVRRAEALEARADAAEDRVAELCAKLCAAGTRAMVGSNPEANKLETLCDEALPVFEAARNDLALYVAYRAVGYLPGLRWDQALEASEKGAAHARRAGHEPPMHVADNAAARFFGTTPASELLAWLDENELRTRRDKFAATYRAGALGMLGRFDEARTILEETRSVLAERGASVLLANVTSFESVWIELWAGKPARAVEFGLEGWRLYGQLGEEGFLSGAAGFLAQALYALDQLDEAETWASRGVEAASAEDPWSVMVLRQVRAKIRARRGAYEEAEQLARLAVEGSAVGDSLIAQGDAYADLGEILALAGKPAEAAAAFEAALERYERKENLALVAQVRPKLAAVRAQAASAVPP